MDKDADLDQYQSDAMDWYLSSLHQMSEGRLAGATMFVDRATWHLFQNHQSLMTEDERRATQYLALHSYANGFTSKKERGKGQNRAKRFLTPEIEKLLRDGEQDFLDLVRQHILREHGNDILNLCPKCGTLARTAQSKQCQKCFYSWHDQPKRVIGNSER